MLENTEEAIQNGQSRETVNVGYTRPKKKTKNKSTIRHVLDTTIYKQTQIT